MNRITDEQLKLMLSPFTTVEFYPAEFYKVLKVLTSRVRLFEGLEDKEEFQYIMAWINEYID